VVKATQSWIRAAVLIGVAYALIGIAFAVPASHVQAWRLAAWALSAIGYGAHIAYEHFQLKNSSGAAALHVAVAVAIGAFGLAVGANVHSLSVASPRAQLQLLRLSLAIWPVITALPAFLVALGINVALSLARRSARDR
jgi:hypothetical protein